MRYIKMTLPVVTAALATMAFTATARAGHAPAQLEEAGFYCINAGPSNFTHCFKVEQLGNPAVPVKVFTEDGNTYLGTEMLLRPDIYRGQTCPQDGLGLWEYNDDVGYFACHHFYTDQH
ncbi:MAG: hypothetical protein PVF89_00550 [Lysobacterales bacterium]|jgi:hypothetical protein